MNLTQAIGRIRDVLRRQHKSRSTETCYIFWLRRYAAFLQSIPVVLATENKIERFLTELACRHDVSASTQNQALNAVVFFYREVLATPIHNLDALRAKRPAQERHAPSISQTQALLQTIKDSGGYPTNLIAKMLYGCGLRVSEPLNLRTKDVDLPGHRLCIRGAKGGDDRVVPLPECLIAELTQQLKFAHAVWHRDRQNRVPVLLPHRLAKKYPDYLFSWGWAWVFPARLPCRSQDSDVLVRVRMHEANVQRAVKHARRKLGISVLPHELRHGYATHCLERGANPRAIQQVMGHKSLETTMGYLHAESTSVTSPLEAISSVPKNRGEFSQAAASALKVPWSANPDH